MDLAYICFVLAVESICGLATLCQHFLQPFSDNAKSSTLFANPPPANVESRHVEAGFEIVARLNSMSERKTPHREPEIEEIGRLVELLTRPARCSTPSTSARSPSCAIAP
jgi:hypothetical protein